MAQHSDISYESTSGSRASTGEEEPIPPFFNTTFSTHRVSPLFIGAQELDQTRLDLLAHRLRDTLVGDVVRGIQIGVESLETSSGQVGPLRYIKMRWFHPSDVLGDEELVGDDIGAGRHPATENPQRGLWIEIRHENASYVALMLPGYAPASNSSGLRPQPWSMRPGQGTAVDEVDPDHFVRLPLLLLRMPQSLKSVIGEWLATTFDCRVSKLSLGTKTLVHIWERWIETAGLSHKGPDFVVTFSFNAPLAKPEGAASDSDEDEITGTEAGLRSMSVAVSPQDLRRFLRAGETLGPDNTTNSAATWMNNARERNRLAGGRSDDGWAWRQAATGDQPFTEALGRYINHHLALNMFHPSVRIVQISCGGFVLAQSRLKIVKVGDITEDLSRAAWMFATQLSDRIQGEGLPPVLPAGVS